MKHNFKFIEYQHKMAYYTYIQGHSCENIVT